MHNTKLTEEQALALEEKRILFEDMEVPFPSEIETKFLEAISNGSCKRDPYIFLDQMCHTYIDYALEHYAEIKLEELREKCGRREILESDIKRIIGKYATKELTKSGLITFVKTYRGSKIYAI